MNVTAAKIHEKGGLGSKTSLTASEPFTVIRAQYCLGVATARNDYSFMHAW
jgi:hypothetical protein